MTIKELLHSLPINFRHEKTFLIQNNVFSLDYLCQLTDNEINGILRDYPLCTLNNLKKIRAIAIFKKEISIPPSEGYLLLHCGIGSIKSLSQLTPYELEQKIMRLERILRVRTETNITLSALKDWINKAQQICKSY